MKSLSPTADKLVPILDEESRLNGILILVDCVGERLTLEIVSRNGYHSLQISYSSYFFLQSIAVACSYEKMVAQVNFIAFWWSTGPVIGYGM